MRTLLEDLQALLHEPQQAERVLQVVRGHLPRPKVCEDCDAGAWYNWVHCPICDVSVDGTVMRPMDHNPGCPWYERR